jgi:riboflavin synthase
MFTGIIEEQGTIQKIVRKDNLAVLFIKADKVLKGTCNGDSIAINGCCLTVTAQKAKVLSFDVIRETLDKTTLGDLKVGSRVNLERAMTAQGRFGGHFVTGHIDGAGVIKNIKKLANDVEFEIVPPKELMKYLVAKGSVTIEGISLTVGKVTKTSFVVHLIPTTLVITTFGGKVAGDRVNVETDILARYILR